MHVYFFIHFFVISSIFILFCTLFKHKLKLHNVYKCIEICITPCLEVFSWLNKKSKMLFNITVSCIQCKITFIG